MQSSAESSASSPPRPSGRKGSRKVRTGCVTCKIRKVKCDETTPFCLRCVKTGRRCDGYLPASRGSPSRKSLSPNPGFDTPEQSRAFDYYRHRSVKILSGTLDTGFWGGTVLKLSVSEPAVRHAMLAVSKLHECVEAKSGKGQDLDRRFAYQEYSKAISCLRKWSHDGEPSPLPLLVCVLFVCFEFLADRQTASQMHICQGRKILTGLQSAQSPVLDLVKQSLVPVYTRLSLASFLYGSRPAAIPQHLNTYVSVPTAFGSLDEARCMLYTLVDRGLQFSARAMPAIFDPTTTLEEINQLQAIQQQLLVDFAQWNSAFIIFSSMDTQTQAFINARHLILVYYHASRIWISTALQTNELKFDAFLPDFASIVSLASSIINSSPNTRPSAFTFETELVAPVYWTVTKCRHPLLRRAALKLLVRDELRGRRENHWHVDDAISIAIRVIEVEEGEIEKPLGGDMDPADPLAGLNNFMKPDGKRPGVVRQRELDPDELRVWSTLPPLVPGEAPIDAELGSDDVFEATSGDAYLAILPRPSPESTSSLSPPREDPIPLRLPQLQASNLEAPFDIPEFRRVKNVTIGPRERRGVWATFFEDPRPGEAQWKITREFISS